MQAISEPKGTGQENPFGTRQAIGIVSFGAITPNETMIKKLAFDRFNRGTDALVGGGQKPNQGHHEEAGIEFLRSVGLSKGALFRMITAATDFAMNAIANLTPPREQSPVGSW